MDFSPALLAAAGFALLLAAAAAAWFGGRRRAWPVAAAVAAVLLGLAALDPRARWPLAAEVVVMIDRSASMRGVDDGAIEARLAALLGRNPYRRIDLGADADETRFEPPAGADSVVLVSDGQFDLPPAAPPVFAVVMPDLLPATAADARVVRLEHRGDEAAATVANDGPPRALAWSHRPDRQVEVPTGLTTFVAPAPPGTALTAALNGGDRWPENDAMTLRVPSAGTPARWWIVPASPPAGWTGVDRARLATAGGFDLLDVEAIAVIDTPAEAIDAAALSAVVGYVRDLGGTLILGGGEQSFAAGGWAGTTLDRLSPLASSPPTPRALWIVLLDASGSMNAPAGGDATRWQRAISAVRDTVPALPPADLLRVGSFAATARWWHDAPAAAGDKDVEKMLQSPPLDVAPRGPTNLQAALSAITDATTEGSLPRTVLVITDGEAQFDDVAALAERMRQANVKLLALTIDPTSPARAVARLAELTGGRQMAEPSPAAWAAAARRLAREAGEAHRLDVRGAIDLAPPLDARVSPASVHETWARDDATVLGTAATPEGDRPAAAVWQAGSGRVLALAFAADPALVDRAATALARPPRDDRFTVGLVSDLRPTLQVRVRGSADATGLTAWIVGADRPLALGRTGPDLYEATLERSNEPRIAEVRLGDRVIDRVAIPAQRPREFDRIGLDRENLLALAEQTGGAVIETEAAGPIDLPRRWRNVPLAPYLAAGAAVVVMAGLIAARKR